MDGPGPPDRLVEVWCRNTPFTLLSSIACRSPVLATCFEQEDRVDLDCDPTEFAHAMVILHGGMSPVLHQRTIYDYLMLNSRTRLSLLHLPDDNCNTEVFFLRREQGCAPIQGRVVTLDRTPHSDFVYPWPGRLTVHHRSVFGIHIDRSFPVPLMELIEYDLWMQEQRRYCLDSTEWVSLHYDMLLGSMGQHLVMVLPMVLDESGDWVGMVYEVHLHSQPPTFTFQMEKKAQWTVHLDNTPVTPVLAAMSKRGDSLCVHCSHGDVIVDKDYQIKRAPASALPVADENDSDVFWASYVY
jgi:hypothetical protein